jgi:transposase
MELFGLRLLTKRAAAKVAGIGYQTLMDWQRQRREWGRALNALHWQTRSQRGAENERRWNERRQARRTAGKLVRPRPTKQMRMVCWHLIHRVHPQEQLTEAHERAAALRFGLSWSRWVAARTMFPLMADVQEKRRRRLAYGLAHGSIAAGWTPPKRGG